MQMEDRTSIKNNIYNIYNILTPAVHSTKQQTHKHIYTQMSSIFWENKIKNNSFF